MTHKKGGGNNLVSATPSIMPGVTAFPTSHLRDKRVVARRRSGCHLSGKSDPGFYCGDDSFRRPAWNTNARETLHIASWFNVELTIRPAKINTSRLSTFFNKIRIGKDATLNALLRLVKSPYKRFRLHEVREKTQAGRYVLSVNLYQ